MELHFTGQNWHELIGVAFGIGLLVHFVLHWRWIVSVTRMFFRKLLHESRFNYLLNLILFVDLLVIIVTGIAISRTLGLNLGIERSLSSTFEQLHKQASSFSLLLVGLHVGLHWKWITTYVHRHFSREPFRRAGIVPTGLAAAPVTVANSSHGSIGGQS